MRTTFFPFDGQCTHIEWAPKGTLLAVQDNRYNNFFIYDLEKQMRLHWTLFSEQHEILQNVLSLAWSPNGHILVVGTQNGFVFLDPLTGVVIRRFTLQGFAQVVNSVAWSRDGRLLALSTSPGDRCLLYEVSSPHTRKPQAMLWPGSPDPLKVAWVLGWLTSQTLVLSTDDQELVSVNLTGWQTLFKEKDCLIQPGLCVVSPTKQKVALVNPRSPQVYVYTLRRTSPPKKQIYQPDPPHNLEGIDWCNRAHLAWSRDGKYLATCFSVSPSRIYVWDANSGLTVEVLEVTFSELVTALAWGPDNQLCWGGAGSSRLAESFQVNSFY